MAKTEEEQIQKEIEAIMQARPEPKGDIDMSPLKKGQPVFLEAFCFGQYRGRALYDGGLVSFPILWEKEEPPPLTVQVQMRQLPNGNLQIEMHGEGFPEVNVVMNRVEE